MMDISGCLLFCASAVLMFGRIDFPVSSQGLCHVWLVT